MRKLFITVLMFIILIMLCACGAQSGSVDRQCMESVSGDYQIVTDNEDENFWHLYISDDDGSDYLSVYDNAAGNPGIEGVIEKLDESHIDVRYDEDYYDQLPSYDWNTDGKLLKLEYRLTEAGIELSNSGTVLYFEREADQEEK